jgi:hypothetical protein
MSMAMEGTAIIMDRGTFMEMSARSIILEILTIIWQEIRL